MIDKPGDRRSSEARPIGRLDLLEVPDLWPSVLERAAAPELPFEPVTRVRRRPLLAAAAAAALVIALITGIAVAGHSDDTTGRPPPPWVVSGSITLPSAPAPSTAEPLIAVTASGLWLVEGHGTELFEITAEPGALKVERTLSVPAVVALAADGRRLWMLGVDGELRVSTDGSEPRSVSALGPLSDARPALAVAGGRVWVAGSSKGELLAVDPTNGGLVAMAGVAVPGLLEGSGSQVWVVDALGTGISEIDAAAMRIRWTTTVGPVGDAVADRRGLWVTDQGTGGLVRLDGGGRTRAVEAEATRGSQIVRLASAGGLVWVGNSQVLQAFDTGGTLRQTVAVHSADVGWPVLAGSPLGVWVVDGGERSVALVTPP